MLGPITVAPRASRSRSPSAQRAGPPGLHPLRPARVPAQDVVAVGDASQGLLFATRARPAAPPVAPRADTRQLELFGEHVPLQPGLLAQHPWRRGADWIPGHPNHRPTPRAFDQPLRRASDRLAAAQARRPESALRRTLREVYDSFNIVVMGVSVSLFLLLSLGSSVWVAKNFMGIDVFPQAHTSEVLLGIEHATPTSSAGFGGGGGARSAGGSSALDALMQARGGADEYPLMGSLGLGPE